jgi:hypothetical protein
MVVFHFGGQVDTESCANLITACFSLKRRSAELNRRCAGAGNYSPQNQCVAYSAKYGMEFANSIANERRQKLARTRAIDMGRD